MRCSVVIPTRPGPGPAARCVAALRSQLTDADEVIISVDGHDADPRLTPDDRLRVITGDRIGPAGVRNRAVAASNGRIVLFLNDDLVPQPGLIGTHLQAHEGSAAMVLGDAPWAVGAEDRVIDRVVRETSWIFFYDRMGGEHPDHDWGFRHAWTLNLSVPRDAVVPFEERLAYPMFDDLEWAWRVKRPVLFRPDARVVHEHRYEPRALLRREALLGHQAAMLHRINPVCAQAAFGCRFKPDDATVSAARDALPDLLRDAAEGYRVFADLANAPARTVGSRDHLFGVFNACRAWRETARLVGSVLYAQGDTAEDAMREVEHAIAGAEQPRRYGGAA